MSDLINQVIRWKESDRLKAIESYDILDTPREEEFEDLVKMAAEACNVPVALISFVTTGRQWFKAALGTEMTETPLDMSICSHAILQKELFIVPDASKDQRFMDNPLVKGGPNIRFYAGALLETPEGLPLGTVCVLDYKPRVFTEKESAALKALARQVMTQLELRRSLSQLRRALEAKNKSEERLNLALESSGFIGIWEWDLLKDRVFADPGFVTVFGGESYWSTEGAPMDEYIKAIHPEDFARVRASIGVALETRAIFQEEYRLVQKDGTVRWIEARGQVHQNDEGIPFRFPGVAVDITKRKLSEQKAQEAAERYRFMTESMPHKILTANGQGEVQFFNHEWTEYTGLDFEQIKDWGWMQVMHPDDLEETVKRWNESIALVKPFEMEHRFRRKDGVYRWHHSKATPMLAPEGQLLMWIGSNADIDDQRRGKEDLENAVAKFRALFDQSAVFAGIMALDGIILEANSLCLEGCGYRAEEVIGRFFWECGWWRGSKETQLKIQDGTKLAAQGVPYLGTFSYHWGDGTERMVDLAINPIRNAAGQIIFLHPTGIDITDRQKAQARTELLAHLTQKLSTVSDPSEINRIATQEIGQFLGVSRCYFFQGLPDEDKVQVLSDWRRKNEPALEGVHRLSDFGLPARWEALTQGSVAIDDVRNHPWTKDFLTNYESIKIIGCIMAPFILEGKWVACLGVSSNQARYWTPDEQIFLEHAVARVWPLIERARVERALRESEERFRAMSDNIAPLAWMADADGWLFWYNKRWYDYTGGTIESMKGEGWAKVHDPVHLPHVISSWRKAIAEGQPWEDTFPLLGIDGQYRWFLSRAFPIRDDGGKISLWFGVNTDITDLREAHALLGDKAAHLESIVQQRTIKLSDTINELEAFSYSISHDMRAPLRAMIGYADLLREEYASKLDAEGAEYLTRIINASRRMDRLIQDVLQFSRISRQDAVLETVNTDWLIRDVILSYPNFSAELADISIEDNLPSIKGNEAFLTQCFSNLLENGTKFVAKGTKPEIRVWAECWNGRVKLYFKDNGIGIAEHSQERIFEIFHRVGRDGNGTGIGLAIVRKAAEKMGGSVGVSSVPGQGSLFWLDLQAG